MSVERVRAGDVLELQRREVAIDPIEEYRRIGVYSFGKGVFHRDPVVGSELGDYRYFAVEPGDLVLSNIQAWEGAIGFATEADSGTIGTHRFLTYVPSSECIEANWARWFFLSEPGMTRIRGAAPGSTMRNRTLAITRFEALEIPLPSIEEQRRTSSLLDRALEFTRSVADSLATARSRVADPAASWLSTAIERIDHEAELGEIATVRRGRGPRYEPGTGLLAINQACIRWGRIDLARAREVAEDWWLEISDSSRVSASDVLVNSTGEGTIGRATLAPQSVVGIPFDSHVLAVTCDERVLNPNFLAVYLRSSHGQAQVNRVKGANTTKQTELGKTKLECFRIPVPSLDTQVELLTQFQRLAARTAQIESKMTEQGERIAAFRPALLNATFGGLA